MKILFLGPLKSTFVKNDFDILSKHHKLIPIDSNIGGGFRGALNLIQCSIKSVFALLHSDMVYVWFADYTSLVPILFAKLIGKKSVVVAGGFDVGYLPELNYGAKARRIRWFCVKNTFRFAKKILPVSNYAMKSLFELTAVPANKVDMVYNCIKSENYKVDLSEENNREYFITVSQAEDLLEFVRKGSDKFIETAKKNSEYQFVLAGLRGRALAKAEELGKNLKNLQIIPGPLSLYDDIIPLYNKSYAYFQLSIEETFGLAVVEAMKCGCVPIVAPNAALPEVAGKYAKIVKTDQDITNAIKYGIEIESSIRLKMSDYSNRFDISCREEKLIHLLNK